MRSITQELFHDILRLQSHCVHSIQGRLHCTFDLLLDTSNQLNPDTISPLHKDNASRFLKETVKTLIQMN